LQRTVGFALGVIVGLNAVAQTIHGREGITLPPPPAVEAIPVVDDYFGTKISDSYRWLEDAKSPETRAFIDAQNAYTAQYMQQARIRPQVVAIWTLWRKSPRTVHPSNAPTTIFSAGGWPANSSSRSTCATDGGARTSA